MLIYGPLVVSCLGFAQALHKDENHDGSESRTAESMASAKRVAIIGQFRH